jgi:nucleoid-associated protein YgaU
MKALGVVLLCLVSGVSSVFSKDREMTYEEYLSTLHAVVAQEKNAREEIAREQGMIENIRQQIAQISVRIAGVLQETYAILGITERDVVEAEAQLNGFRSVFQQLLFMTDQDFAAKRAEFAEYISNFTAFRSKRVCLLYKVAALVNDIDALISQVRLRFENTASRVTMPTRSDVSSYVVGKHGNARTLWEIAAEVYGDPHEWPRIYRANKRRIDRWFERYTARDGNGLIYRPQDFLLSGRKLAIPQ